MLATGLLDAEPLDEPKTVLLLNKFVAGPGGTAKALLLIINAVLANDVIKLRRPQRRHDRPSLRHAILENVFQRDELIGTQIEGSAPYAGGLFASKPQSLDCLIPEPSTLISCVGEKPSIGSHQGTQRNDAWLGKGWQFGAEVWISNGGSQYANPRQL